MSGLNDLFSMDDDDSYYDFDDNERSIEDEDHQVLTGFHRDKGVNGEWFSPFLVAKKKFCFITTDKLVEFLNSNDENWYLWAECDSGLVFSKEHKELSADKIVPLPPGIYTHEGSNSSLPERLVTYEINREDEILELGNAFAKVKGYVKDFLGKKEVYESVKTPYKLGILMWGPPGNGKSLLLSRLIEEHPEAIVIYMDPSSPIPSRLFMSKLDALTKDTLKIFVFEELTTNLDSKYVGWLLSFLDGEASIANSINIALTNYPEALPENVVNRPSRFDKLVHFDNPEPEERKKVFHHFMGREASEAEIKETAGFSIAGIKELCMSVRINDLTFLEALDILKKRSVQCKKQFQKSEGKTGF